MSGNLGHRRNMYRLRTTTVALRPSVITIMSALTMAFCGRSFRRLESEPYTVTRHRVDHHRTCCVRGGIQAASALIQGKNSAAHLNLFNSAALTVTVTIKSKANQT